MRGFVIFTLHHIILGVMKSWGVGWVGHMARMGEMKTYKIFVGKSEVKGSLGKRRCRCEVNIGMDFRDTGWEGVDWMHLIQDWINGGLS
jgi:hypothetical protein